MTVAQPHYPIRVASRLTSIPEGTLRMWERRYGFPNPDRESNGARLYTQADIEQLRLFARCVEQGFRPHQISGHTTQELSQLLVREVPESRPKSSKEPRRVRGLSSRIDEAVEALERNDALRLRQVLRGSAIEHGASGFVVNVAQPLMARIGELWECGRIDIRHEHLATELVAAELAAFHSAIPISSDPRPPLVLLATPPEEHHTLGLAMIAVSLAVRGAETLVLGRTPVDEIARAARAHRADIVGIAASRTDASGEATRDLLRLKAGLPRGTQLWAGGAGARSLAKGVAGATVVDSWSALDVAFSKLAARRSKLKKEPS